MTSSLVDRGRWSSTTTGRRRDSAPGGRATPPSRNAPPGRPCATSDGARWIARSSKAPLSRTTASAQRSRSASSRRGPSPEIGSDGNPSRNTPGPGGVPDRGRVAGSDATGRRTRATGRRSRHSARGRCSGGRRLAVMRPTARAGNAERGGPPRRAGSAPGDCRRRPGRRDERRGSARRRSPVRGPDRPSRVTQVVERRLLARTDHVVVVAQIPSSVEERRRADQLQLPLFVAVGGAWRLASRLRMRPADVPSTRSRSASAAESTLADFSAWLRAARIFARRVHASPRSRARRPARPGAGSLRPADASTRCCHWTRARPYNRDARIS